MTKPPRPVKPERPRMRRALSRPAVGGPAAYISRQAMVRRLPPYFETFCEIASPE